LIVDIIWGEYAMKTLIIMRGVSGSGKSTLARAIQKLDGGVIFSTDDFFTDEDGVYRFDPKKIGMNHIRNQNRTEEAMRDGVSPIIVDNTNVRAWEMKPYVNLADKYGYEIIIKQPGDPDFPSVSFDEIMKRQEKRAGESKSLSSEVVERMLQNFEPSLSLDDIRSSVPPFRK
jgi:NEDD4-binding protein 2